MFKVILGNLDDLTSPNLSKKKSQGCQYRTMKNISKQVRFCVSNKNIFQGKSPILVLYLHSFAEVMTKKIVEY